MQCLDMTLFGRPAVPSDGFNGIRGGEIRWRGITHITEVVHPPEHVLCLDMVLLGRPAIPSAGFGVIVARKVHLSEGELRVGVALLGGFTVPGGGFGVILRHAIAVGVHDPEVGLRIRIAGLGAGAQVGKFLCC